MIKIAFYVSGKVGRLRKIIMNSSPVVIYSIKIVVCDNLDNSDLQATLKRQNINFIEFDYESLHIDKKERGLVLSDKLNDIFQEHEIDYCFCFGDHILKGKLLNNYKNRIINFHPSLLPHFPGRMAIDKALDENTFLLGNTAHFIDSGIDTGPIIMQNVVSREIFNKMGYDGVLDQQVIMFEQIFRWLSEDRLTVKDSAVQILNARYDGVTFFPKTELS